MTQDQTPLTPQKPTFTPTEPQPDIFIPVAPPEPVGTEKQVSSATQVSPPKQVMKRCAKCNQSFPRTPEFFYSDHTCRDGFNSYCKTCCKAASKASYARYRTRMVAYRKFIATPDALCPEGFRACVVCGTVKPLTITYFHKHLTSKGGFHTACKQCRNALSRRKRETSFQTPQSTLDKITSTNRHELVSLAPAPTRAPKASKPIKPRKPVKLSELDKELMAIVPDVPTHLDDIPISEEHYNPQEEYEYYE